MKRLPIFFLLALVGLGATSCIKKTVKPLTTDQVKQISEDHQIAQGETDNLGNYVTSYVKDNGYGKTNGFGFWTLPNGITGQVTEVGQNEWNIKIDFGSTGVLCNDGRRRKGKVLVHAKGLYREPGSILTVTTQDYYSTTSGGQTFHKHNLRKTIENKGRNAANNLEYQVAEWDTVTLGGETAVIFWQSDRINEWTGGESTLIDWTDDVYKVRGTATSKRDGANAYLCQWSTVTPLEVQLGCRTIVSGVLSIKEENDPDPVTVDYGSGCATLKFVTVKYKALSVVVTI